MIKQKITEVRVLEVFVTLECGHTRKLRQGAALGEVVRCITCEENAYREAHKHCPKCGGAGWLWGHELDNYYGENPSSDDTRYSCDSEVCNGTETHEDE